MTTVAEYRAPSACLAPVRRKRRRPPRARSGTAIAHLAVLGGLLAAAVFADGGTAPEIWLGCHTAAGVLLVSWAITMQGARGPSSALRFPLVALALPLYAALQAVPLPYTLVRLLSPARAEIHESIARLMPEVPSWTPLSFHAEATLDFAFSLLALVVIYWLARGLGVKLAGSGFAVAAPIVLVAAAQSVIALLQSFAQEPATGSYVNRNHLAGLLEMALPFAVVPAVSLGAAAFRGRHSRSKRSLSSVLAWGAAGGTALLIFAATLATRSRAGLISALVSLLVTGLAAVKRSTTPRKKWLPALVLPALLAAAFLYLPSENLVRRYTHVLSGEGLRREGRILLWRETLDLIGKSPLAGCGFGAFEPAFLRYKRSAPMVNDTHAHNDFLELFAEGGAIGFALFVVLVARPIAAALRASICGAPHPVGPVALACVGSMAAILVHSFVDFNLRIPANGFVFVWVLGLCSASGIPEIVRCSERHKPEERLNSPPSPNASQHGCPVTGPRPL
jgi:O-antigen ligase